MGIMSDRTKAINQAAIQALSAGLRLAGQNAFADLLDSMGTKLLEAGYNHLGMTDEVTVKVDGKVTGEITK